MRRERGEGRGRDKRMEAKKSNEVKECKNERKMEGREERKKGRG